MADISSQAAAQPERHRRPLTLWLSAALLILLVAAALVASFLPLRNASNAYLEGQVAQAIAAGERWSRIPLWRGQYHQLLAAAYLTAGKNELAQPHLAALKGRRLWIRVLATDEVAKRLFARGRYEDFLAYDASVSTRHDSADVALYRAAAQLVTNRAADAENTLRGVDRAKADPKKLGALEAAVAQRRSGAYPLIVDRNGKTIASWQIANHDLVAVDAQFAPIVEKEAGTRTFESALPQLGLNDTVATTLDPDVQRAALAALSGFRGSLVAIDPRTNEILAIASSRGNGAMANLAIEQQYEPGSVVKVLTGLNAISGGGVSAMFPYNCTGDLPIDGRHFADWLPAGHGPLPSIDEALAQSCNIVFGDIGLRLGADRLRSFMTTAGFDGQTDLGAFQAPLGRIIASQVAGGGSQTWTRYDTALLAIGLQHETMNSLHVAMIASAMANRGVLTAPRLIRERRSVLGETVGTTVVQGKKQLAPAEAAAQMIRAMTAVVTSAKGTGRRAAVEGLTIAMKTGTAGSRKEGGLESVILAFAPVEHPAIAFGMIAEDAGPAEFAGAKIAHDFLMAVKGRK